MQVNEKWKLMRKCKLMINMEFYWISNGFEDESRIMFDFKNFSIV